MSSCSHVIFCPTARSLLLVHCKSVCWSNRERACTYFLCKSSQSLSRAAQNPNHKEYKKDKQANKQNWFGWSDWVFIEDKDNSITPFRGPVWKIWSIINDACDAEKSCPFFGMSRNAPSDMGWSTYLNCSVFQNNAPLPHQVKWFQFYWTLSSQWLL